MDSQGPSLSEGFPEHETGASNRLEDSNDDIDHRFHKNDEIAEEDKRTLPDSSAGIEISSSSLLDNELHVTTTCANTVNEKQFPLAGATPECCEPDHTSADQDCSFIVHDNLEEHMSSHFEDGHSVDHDEELVITFPRSVYGEISDKDIVPFHAEGEENQLREEEKSDFQLISVDGRVVPEYMRNINPLCSAGVNDLVDQCSSTTLQNDQQSDGTQTASSMIEHSHINSETVKVVSNQEEDAASTLVQEKTKQAESQEIMIKVYPNTQGISVVTSNILPADVTTFSTQVPAILTEGDAEDSEAHYQVVTSGSMLNNGVGTASLDAMTSNVDFPRSVILSQQQVLLSGMLVPGGVANQAIHINMPHDTNTCVDVNAISQHEQQGGAGESLDGKGHACPVPDCNVVCAKAYKLKLHMLSHSEERPFKCPHEGCDWAFSTSYKLKRHMRGHTGEKPFLCPHEGCGKCFTTAYNLKSHLKAHFRTDTHACRYEGCEKTFATAHKLKVHERRHQTENKSHRCEMEGCGKVFSAHGTLTSHMKIHSGEKPHPCPVIGCEKRFTKASKLKLHLRSHTGERPFHCEVEGCGWSFTSAYKLKRHMRKHTGERPFICSYDSCGKSFSRSSHLKTHMLVHTGEKPYVCPVEGCNKAFTAGSSLNVHMCKHTGQKPFKCDVEGCGKTYTTAANLRVHQKRHGIKAIVVDFNDPTQSELGTAVSCGSTTSETETEIMYTTIGPFHAGSLNVEDAAHLTSVGVQLPSSLSATTLCALVTSAGHSLVSPSAEAVFDDTEKKQSDNSGINTINATRDQAPTPGQQTQFVAEGLGNSAKMDVAEYVVRCTATDEHNTISPSTQGRVEVVEGAVLQGDKLGSFDLCITSMMSHITSEDSQHCAPHCTTKTLQPSGMSSGPSERSRTLDFRDVHPDDQFAPPAVIFQDEVKSSDTENETEVLVGQVQQSPEGIPIVQLSRESLAINLPKGLTAATAVGMPCMPEVEHMEVDVDCNQGNTSDASLEPIPSLPEVTEENNDVIKSDLSPYMDNHSPSEQDVVNGDTYPESTINLQDLR